jgi:hypothetical protein
VLGVDEVQGAPVEMRNRERPFTGPGDSTVLRAPGDQVGRRGPPVVAVPQGPGDRLRGAGVEKRGGQHLLLARERWRRHRPLLRPGGGVQDGAGAHLLGPASGRAEHAQVVEQLRCALRRGRGAGERRGCGRGDRRGRRGGHRPRTGEGPGAVERPGVPEVVDAVGIAVSAVPTEEDDLMPGAVVGEGLSAALVTARRVSDLSQRSRRPGELLPSRAAVPGVGAAEDDEQRPCGGSRERAGDHHLGGVRSSGPIRASLRLPGRPVPRPERGGLVRVSRASARGGEEIELPTDRVVREQAVIGTDRRRHRVKLGPGGP